MYTTINDKGILNNYSTEGKISYAQCPTIEQQKTISNWALSRELSFLP